MLAAHTKFGFSNTASGKMNKNHQINKFKEIAIDDLDVQMLSNQFLQAKTLKKPMKEYQINLKNTNPFGVQSFNRKSQNKIRDPIEVPNYRKPSASLQRKQEPEITYLQGGFAANIKPAYKTVDSFQKQVPTILRNNYFDEKKDGNTIFSALMKKGQKIDVIPEIKIISEKSNESTKSVGPAEAKLKNLLSKKQVKFTEQPKKKISTFTSLKQDIGEQIHESIQDYGNESFQKLSVGHESAIRQSIAGESAMIKESIMESIRESVADSSSGKIKEDIKEEISQSRHSMREEINEEISGSIKKSRVSVEEVYEEIFQEESLSGSLNKSQNKFQKSGNLSDSASKSFRMKSNLGKSIKLAEELSKKQVIIPKRVELNEILKESIENQKQKLQRIQNNISKIFKENQKKESKKSNKELLYNFKIEINKLLTSQNFQSKLKKLTSFIKIDDSIVPSNSYVNDLEENILKNVLKQIQNIKTNKQATDQIAKLKAEYEQNLQFQLKRQQINLKAELNQKLSAKDLEYKRMIAQLQSRLMGMTVAAGSRGIARQQIDFSKQPDHFEFESDASIDSDNVSWKMDLWDLLPDYEKKKLYQKQSNEVAKFLTSVMMKELKQEALDRSIDISFEFPDQDSSDFKKPKLNAKFYQSNEEDYSMPKPAFNRRQLQVEQDKIDYMSSLPKLPQKPTVSHNENINQYAKDESQVQIQIIKKNHKIKAEIIKILSEYKNIYLKKKADVVKKIIKVVQSKQKQTQNLLYSSLQQISILTQKQYKQQHKMYIKAYEEELIWGLVGIYNKSTTKKVQIIEEDMKKMYDRLVVTAQIQVADNSFETVGIDAYESKKLNDLSNPALTRENLRKLESTPCPIEISPNEAYMKLKTAKEEKQVQGDIVQMITKILAMEFAAEFPKRKV